MSKNPYYDDSDDGASDDFGFDEVTPEAPVPAPPVVSAPETSGGNSGIPAWAQITSDLADNDDDDDYDEVVQVPVPPPYTPPAPATPARPPVVTTPPETFVPVPMPVPVPVPEPLRPAPKPPTPPVEPEEEAVQKEPSDRVPSEASAPTPRRRKDPVPPPTGTNRRKPSEPDYDEDDLDYEDDPVPPKPRSRRREPEPEPVQVTHEPEPQKKRFGFGGGKKSPKSSSSTTVSQPGRFSGGRGLALALKAIIWIAVGFVILSGARAIFAPATVDVNALSAQVQTDLNLSSFPVAIGEDTALQFARDYLSFNEESRKTRTATLSTYLPLSSQGQKVNTGWMALSGDLDISQEVVAGPFLVETPLIDGDHATYLITAQVIQRTSAVAADGTPVEPSGTWVTISVPITMDEGQRVAVGGAPGIVPGALRAQVGSPAGFTSDPAAESSLGQELPNFLTAWAASDPNGLKRYTPEEASPIVSEGLGGIVKYVSFQNLKVELVTPATGYRKATVDITWDSNGVQITQQYRMIVYQASTGLWYVEYIEGGGYTMP